MKKTIGAIALVLLLAGCASSAPSETPSASPTPTTDALPACSTLIGKPTRNAVDPETQAPLCITGSDAARDETSFGTTNCDPVNESAQIVYFWFSRDDAAPDQAEYVAMEGGAVTIVDGASGESEATVAQILSTVGCG